MYICFYRKTSFLNVPPSVSAILGLEPGRGLRLHKIRLIQGGRENVGACLCADIYYYIRVSQYIIHFCLSCGHSIITLSKFLKHHMTIMQF